MESKKRIGARVIKIIGILEKEYPEAGIQLEYYNPFDLLVATILSAQCTDNRVNIVKYLRKNLKKTYSQPAFTMQKQRISAFPPKK